MKRLAYIAWSVVALCDLAASSLLGFAGAGIKTLAGHLAWLRKYD